MASIASDFSLQVKKISPDVGIGSNYNNESDFNATRTNPYKRAITLDNTGKTAKTNYTVCVVYNHLSDHLAYNSAYNFNDLRVYDSDGTTPLSFFVQSPANPATCIFIVVPSIASNSTKTIYFEYGNPALASLSDSSVIGSIFSNATLTHWFMGNYRDYRVSNNQLDPSFNSIKSTWANEKSNFDFVANGDSAHTPILSFYQVNGIETINFNNFSSPYTAWLTGQNTLPIPSVQNLTVFVVFRPPSSSAHGNLLKIGNGTPNGVAIGIGTSVTDNSVNGNNLLALYENSRWISVATSIGTGFNVVAMTISSGSPSFYLNNTNIGTIAGTNPIDPTGGLIIGANSNGISRNFSGDIAEILIFQSALGSTDRDTVRSYINNKYRLYSITDMPTISIGSQTNTSNTSWSYTSYAPVGAFNISSKLSNGVFGSSTTSATAKIQNVFRKTLATGIDAEGWTNSTQYTQTDPLSNLIQAFSRKNTITTSALVDSVSIQALDLSSNNLNDLSTFYLPNEVNSTTYNSTDLDYIELDFACDTVANISLANSYLRFESSGATTTYQASLSLNQNTLVDGISNKIKIKKGDFTKTGTGNWSNMITFKCNFQTTSGSQSVYYANLILNKNVDQAVEYIPGEPIVLKNSVSSDDGATYYQQSALGGVIDTRLLNEDDVSFTILDYFEKIKTKRFVDLPSFPNNNLVGITSSPQTWLNDNLKYILSFCFPSSFYDVDINFLNTGDDYLGLWYTHPTYGTIQNYKKQSLFSIDMFDTIGSVIEKILNATLGYITFDPINNRLIARSGYKTWYNPAISTADLTKPTPFVINDNLIDDGGYLSDTTTNDFIFNRLKFKLNVFPNIFNQGSIYFINFYNSGSNEVIAANARKKVYLDQKDNVKYNVSVTYYVLGTPYTINSSILDYIYIPINSIYVQSWVVSTDPNASYNNTGVSIIDTGIENGVPYVTFYNSNSTDRYLGYLTLKANCVPKAHFLNSNIGNTDFQYFLEDLTSQKKYGIKELEIDADFAYTTLTEPIANNTIVTPSVAFLYTYFLNNFKDPHEVVQVRLNNYIPELILGLIVQIKNRQGRLLTGTVIAIDHNSEPPEMNQVITVREI